MKKSVVIVGGGPAALMLAAFIDPQQYSVALYEQNKAVGRKFLVAGKGGFNLTHSEPLDVFTERYTPPDFLRPALQSFSNEHLRTWLAQIGLPTFVGSSKRVYPLKSIKPIEVLNKILKVLHDKHVSIHTEAIWTAWAPDGSLLFEQHPPVKADYYVFALGGGSWSITGSDGKWFPKFAEQGIPTTPFLAANCAYQINWPTVFIAEQEGQPLKNIAITCDDKKQKGEAVITRFGLEGNAIYALSPHIQQQLDQQQFAQIFLDLKPTLTSEDVLKRITTSKQKSTSATLRKVLKLSVAQAQLLRSQLTKEQYLTPALLAQHIKQLPLRILNSGPIDEAISTTGGIALSAINSNFELKFKTNNFCIGEMLDWNAPTGGYLLQACFSMGVHLAQYLNHNSNE